ncbi:hypothetical protein BCV70DRAFT_87645 [Testicularia cyperi]|uniref:Uncharacterized protein n=1 Tax=Testicularia cyperi TaxID=1882483 RepID=A0A317XRL8_9BASI|nr:hypothetical protein BCV70DRAFT_87645 [Testicularia cyperi]
MPDPPSFFSPTHTPFVILRNSALSCVNYTLSFRVLFVSSCNAQCVLNATHPTGSESQSGLCHDERMNAVRHEKQANE